VVGAPEVRVFLSAAREARPYALPTLIAGFEAEVTLEQARAGEVGVVGALDPHADVQADSEVPRLVGRPTGRQYRGLPWWEVVVRR